MSATASVSSRTGVGCCVPSRPSPETSMGVLRGWSEFLRYGNSTHHFDAIRDYALMRLALVVRKRHQRARAYGWSVVAFQVARSVRP